MNLEIRPVKTTDTDELFEITIAAFSPVFSSFSEILGDDIYYHIWPDWKAGKRKSIEKLTREDSPKITFVAECDSAIAGFVTYTLDSESNYGMVQLIAVHPDYQCKGIGMELNLFALEKMKEGGMQMASADTGGDDSHLPARKSYEKAGYTGLPLVRYFKKL